MATFRTGAATFCIQELGEEGGTGHAEDVANSISGTTFGGELGDCCLRPASWEIFHGYQSSSMNNPNSDTILGANIDVVGITLMQTLTLGVDTTDTLTLTMIGVT